jgi:hypothetical protein
VCVCVCVFVSLMLTLVRHGTAVGGKICRFFSTCLRVDLFVLLPDVGSFI